MRLTSTAIPLLGVGSKVCPISATRMAYQIGVDPTWRIETADFDGSHPVTEASHGAQTLRGGGDVWAADAPGGVAVRGGLGLPNDGILDVGPDGLVYVTTYQAGEDIRVYFPNAHQRPEGVRPILTLTTPPILKNATSGPQFCALRGMRFAWLAGDVLTHGLPTFTSRRDPSISIVRLAETPNGQVYVLERGPNWLMLRPIESLDGWQIPGDGEHFFSPDVVALDDQRLVVGWAHWEGEGPDAGRTVTIDVTTPRAPLVIPVPVEPPLDLNSLPLLERTLWVGVEYAFPDEGNCTWGYHAQRTHGRPVLEGVEHVDRDDPSKGTWLDTVPAGHPLFAIYDSPKDNPQYSAAAQEAARRLGVPRLRYWDGSTYEDAPGEAYLAGVQAYPQTPFSVTTAECRRLADQGRKLVLIWPAYDAAGWWTRAAVIERLRQCVELANELEAVVGLIGYGRLRPGGFWPDLDRAWAHIVSRMPVGMPPALVAPPPPTPPTVETPDTPPPARPPHTGSKAGHGGGSGSPNTSATIGAAVVGGVLFAQSEAGKKTGRGLKKFFGWLKFW